MKASITIEFVSLGLLGISSALAPAGAATPVVAEPTHKHAQGISEKATLRVLEAYRANAIAPHTPSWEIVTRLVDYQQSVVNGTLPKTLKVHAPAKDRALRARHAYDQLLRHFERIGKAEHIERALYAYRLSGAPEQDKEAILESLAHHSLQIQGMYSTPGLSDLIEEAIANIDSGIYTPEQQRTILAMRHDHVIHTAIPDHLAQRLAYIASRGRKLHVQLKRDRDGRDAIAWLKDVFDAKREIGAVIATKLELDTPYDGVLAMVQPGCDSKRLDVFFETLIPEVSRIAAHAIRNQHGKPTPSLPDGPYDLRKQAELNTLTARALGYDPKRFHLSFSDLHSVEGGIPGDVRLVVNLSDSRIGDFVSSNRSTFHEIGHGLYIDGIPEETIFTPLGKLMGTGVEEGIAFLTEKMITRSRPYAQFIAPRARGIFNKDIQPRDYYRVRTWVKNSLIRIDADEVTYPLHIYIRMQIERDIVNGNMDIESLPKRWNELYQRLVDNTPESPGQGFAQDVHWFVGKVGMFPFYTVGDAIAAQLWLEMREDIPNADDHIQKGNLAVIRTWLNQRVFSRGRFTSIDDFMIAVTGEPLHAKYLIKHLEARYMDNQ